MNILLISVNVGKAWELGGIESHSGTLASVLVKNGHNVIMGCHNEDSVKVGAGRLAVPARRIDIRNSLDMAAVFKIIKIIMQNNIQLVIANGGREYWPSAVAAKLLKRKVIFVRHQRDRIRKTTRWLINNHVDRVIAVSGAVKDVMLNSGVDPGKIEVIYNAIDLEQFNPDKINRADAREELGVDNDDIVIGTVGKLRPGKGVFEIIHAAHALMGKYPALKLLFVGDGPERQPMERELKRLSISDRVIFTGLRDDVERMYAAMDIFVLPSYNEGLPTALVEAMAMATPVIATTIGGILEMINDGIDGILIPPKDHAALADAIVRYIDDAGFAERTASAGRKKTEEIFSERMMGDDFERVFRNMA